MTTGKTIALFYECFKPAFSLSSVTLIKRLFSSSSLSAIREVSSAYLTFTRLLSRNAVYCMLLVAPEIKVDGGGGEKGVGGPKILRGDALLTERSVVSFLQF